jgi:beta-lactamase regulating signal transducer with metallopeptidase domain
MKGTATIALATLFFTHPPSSSAQTSQTIQTSQHDASETDQPPAARLMKWREMLVWGMVLLIVLVVAVGALVRFSRAYKSFIVRGGSKPTPSEDVWSMHRLPPEEGPEGESPRKVQ